MKNHLLTCLLAFLAFSYTFSQPSRFRLNLGTSSYLKDFVQVPNGHYWMSYSQTNSNVLAEFDQDGVLIWAQELHSSLIWSRIIPHPSGKVYTVGTYAASAGNVHLAAGMYTATGENLWITTLDTATNYVDARGCLLGNGKLLVTGKQEYNPNPVGSYVGVIDTAGTVAWQQVLPGIGETGAMALGQDQAILAIGSNDYMSTNIMRLNGSGGVIWSKVLENVKVVDVTPRGDSLLYIGATMNASDERTALCVFDTAGNFRWGRDFSYIQSVEDVTIKPNGDVLISGSLFVMDIFIPYTKTSYTTYSPSMDVFNHEGFRDMGQGGAISRPWITSDLGYLIAYNFDGSPGIGAGLILEKCDMTFQVPCDTSYVGALAPPALAFAPVAANFTPSACSPSASVAPHAFVPFVPSINVLCSTVAVSEPRLESLLAFPNPSGGQARLQWRIESFPTDHLTLEIWNSCGQLVRREALPNAGTAEFATGDQPSGIYFVVVQGGGAALRTTVVKQ